MGLSPCKNNYLFIYLFINKDFDNKKDFNSEILIETFNEHKIKDEEINECYDEITRIINAIKSF